MWWPFGGVVWLEEVSGGRRGKRTAAGNRGQIKELSVLKGVLFPR